MYSAHRRTLKCVIRQLNFNILILYFVHSISLKLIVVFFGNLQQSNARAGQKENAT